MNVPSTINAVNAGITTTANRGCDAIAAIPKSPATATPGGNQRAGRRSESHANQTAPRTNPIRAIAIDANTFELSSSNTRSPTEPTSRPIANTNTTVRLPKRELGSRSSRVDRDIVCLRITRRRFAPSPADGSSHRFSTRTVNRHDIDVPIPKEEPR